MRQNSMRRRAVVGRVSLVARSMLAGHTQGLQPRAQVAQGVSNCELRVSTCCPHVPQLPGPHKTLFQPHAPSAVQHALRLQDSWVPARAPC